MTINVENTATNTVCGVGSGSLTLCSPLAQSITGGRVSGYFSEGIRIPVTSTAGAGEAAPFISTPGSYPPGDVAVGLRIGDVSSGVWEEIRGRLSKGVLYADDGWGGLLRNDYPAGTSVFFVKKGHQSIDDLPTWDRIYRWGIWFPAMAADVGEPDPNGYNGGAVDQHWLRGYNVTPNPANCNLANVGGDDFHCADVQRRDYTNAMILLRAGGISYETGVGESELDTPSKIICLPDGAIGGPCSSPAQYYRLYADGTTGPALNGIQLKAGEGAVLLKQPIAKRIT
jgi:hypothetical protein